MRLFLASIFTLLILSGFIFSVFLILLFFLNLINVLLLIGLTILFNFIMWLIGPPISDWIYRHFYKMRWITIEEIGKKDPKSAALIINTCKKYKFNIPRLGIIADKNPNAFTYGSGRWNSRIIVTEGIFHYLDDNEISSVYGHELGHVKNRDFIIMTIASTLLQILYEVYVVSRNASKSSSNGGKKGGSPLAIIAVISYIFYWIGQYLVLYLSRVREYFADRFSARETNPNYLSSALIKISYGILVNPDDVRLVKSTRFIGIANFKLSENIGIVYYNCKKLRNFEPLNKALLYDIKNPWAFVTELSSTHPLTGKRIRRLSKLSTKPLFDFSKIEEKYPVDKGRLYSNFLKDLFASALIPIAVLFPIIYFSLSYLGYTAMSFKLLVGGFLIITGASVILSALYRYPDKQAEKATVLDLISDIYASPVRGKAVEMNGRIIGRGVPGLIFSEDMIMQDRTGLMFLNYESWFPFFGNLIFGIKKVPKLLNKNARITGWFVRGVSPMVGLKLLETEDGKVKGYVKLGGIIGGFILIILGSIAYFLIPAI